MPTTKLTIPQTEFFDARERYVAAVAGFGSGKTRAAVSRIVATKFKYPTVDLAYLAPSYGLIRDIFFPYMSEVLSDMKVRFKINASAHNIYIQGHGKIFCRTMDNPDMIVGWQAGDAFLDEFDILKTEKAHAVMRKLSARLRQKFPDGKKNQRFVTTTPEGFKATYELFKKNPLPDSKLVQMSTYSNPHNPDDYIQGLIDLYPDQLIKAYLNGEFVNLTTGTVYYTYDRERCNTHYVAKPRETLHIGMDFNMYKMAAIIMVMREKKLYVVDELINLRDTPDMILELKDRYNGHPIYIYPDSSGKHGSTVDHTQSDINLLKTAKFSCRYPSRNPFIRDRVASVNNGFEKDFVKVNVERCPRLCECLEQQIYDGNGSPDKENDLDHPNDALGYPMFYFNALLNQGGAIIKMGGM